MNTYLTQFTDNNKGDSMDKFFSIKKTGLLRIPGEGSVEVESNGYCGGDAGHGGCHEIVFNYPNGYCIEAISEEEMLKISAKGDWELDALIRFFKKAAELLEQIKREVGQVVSCD